MHQLQTTTSRAKYWNRVLQFRLFPDRTAPIYCNSVTDPKDEIFNQPLKK